VKEARLDSIALIRKDIDGRSTEPASHRSISTYRSMEIESFR